MKYMHLISKYVHCIVRQWILFVKFGDRVLDPKISINLKVMKQSNFFLTLKKDQSNR